MKVLMLGWDFSPRLSGGVGSACQGLANALARGTPATEVVFVLPRLRGDEEPEKVRLLASENHASAALTREPLLALRARAADEVASAPHAPRRSSRPPAPSAPVASPAEPPTLPDPSESLRLLAIDSPLRPYLSAQDYAEVVEELLERIRKSQPSAPAPPARGRRSRAAAALAEQPAPVAPRWPELVRVPPYGTTLTAEIERYARTVLARVQSESYDVIHAHDWMTFPAGMLLKELTGKPLVCHFHSNEVERRGPLPSREARALEQAGLERADRVLCTSERSGSSLRAHYAFEPGKLRVLHNAFSPPGEPREREKGAGPVILYLGRLAAQKGPDVYLRAASLVHERHPDARFHVAGAGELFPELVALVEELGLEERVHFTGFVAGEELAQAYANADVYVLSSHAEPFGISALEALSMGVPTVVPRQAGVTEVVRSVLWFEPGDARSLADRILALLERPALRRQLARSGMREVKKVRWDRPARALRGIYDELVVSA